jgi:threonylcarbamoyladenosine tRNA methylthiotransferase MtaB
MAHRQNPDIFIIVTGCYAQRAAAELTAIAGVNRIVDNSEKPNLLEIVKNIPMKCNPEIAEPQKSSTFRTRSFLKIQDGCQNFCSYCIVPFVRSCETSVPPVAIIDEINKRTAEGYQEVALTGTRLGGYHFEGLDLTGLLQRILAETKIPRVRLSSVQPQEISGELIKLWQDARLCPHFHLSLQSGSAAVLKRMNRRYSPADYQKAVKLIRQKVPAVAITTDVIVGFPGETDAEFEESLEFCKQSGFARIHVFSYSPRSGTAAVKMAAQVTDKIKKERSKKMLVLAAESAQQFRESFAGEALDVLWEKQTDDGDWTGMTGNYIRVFAKSKEDLSNKKSKIKIQ